MAVRIFSRTGLKLGWSTGEDGWGSDMNNNLELEIFLSQPNVVDKDLTAPPGSPTIGDMYIPAATATGDWAGEENNLAIWWQAGDDSSPEWKFFTMGADQEGITVWVEDEDVHYVWDGTAWAALKDTIVLELNSASNTALGASHPSSNILGLSILPEDATLVSCKVSCSSVSVTTGVTVDVYLEDGSPASILSSAVTIGDTDDLVVKTGTLGGTTSFSADDLFSLRVATGTGDDITNVVATLEFKANLRI